MKPEHEQHLANIQMAAAEAIGRKYRAGQERHGGRLWELSPERLVDEALAEATDQMVYLLELKAKLACNCRIGGRMPVAHEHGSDDSCRLCREVEQ